MHHGHRDGPVQRDHRVRRDVLQQLVQREDLRPVGGVRGARASSCTAAIAACSWYGPAAAAAAERRRCSSGDTLGDQRPGPSGCGPARPAGPASPSGPVRAGRRASVSSISASRPATSPSSGSSRCSHPGQPDRLGGQVGAVQARRRGGGVALVEDQVQHVQHRAQPLPARSSAGGMREPGTPAGLDPLLGPADALGHRRLRDQERRGDLRGGQAADGAQGQRDLAGRGQGRVAAQEQQGQRVVPVPAPGSASAAGRAARTGAWPRRPVLAAATGLLAAGRVDQPPGRDGQQPAPRVLRDARRAGHCSAAASSASWMASSQASKCPYRRSQRAEDLRRQLAQQVPGRPGRWSSGSGPAPSGVGGGLVQDRPEFDRVLVGPRHVRGDLLGPLVVLAVQQVEAGDVLLRLQVRPVA